MSVFVPNFILINLILRLLTLSGGEGYGREEAILLSRLWRERALEAPRGSYKKIHRYEKAITFDPAFAEAHLELGELYYDLAISYGHRDLHRKAQQSFTEAVALAPDSVEAHYRLGTVYFLLRDFQRCRSELEKAREIDPGYQPVEDSLRLLERIQNPASR